MPGQASENPSHRISAGMQGFDQRGLYQAADRGGEKNKPTAIPHDAVYLRDRDSDFRAAMYHTGSRDMRAGRNQGQGETQNHPAAGAVVRNAKGICATKQDLFRRCFRDKKRKACGQVKRMEGNETAVRGSGRCC